MNVTIEDARVTVADWTGKWCVVWSIGERRFYGPCADFRLQPWRIKPDEYVAREEILVWAKKAGITIENPGFAIGGL